ncbi:Secretory phospholipase A2 receptor [Bulinus truncatus]|nr:Secretory phospholipase A2 receptor [Bulinus truncatus]
MTEDKMYIVRSFQVFLLLGYMSAHAAISAEDGTNVSCLADFTKILRGCYKFGTDVELGWTEAHDKCKEYGAELVVILSESEKDVLQQHLVDNYPDGSTWWAGLNRKETSGFNWRWLDGSAVIVKVTPWFNQRAIVRSGEFSGTLDIKSKKLFIGTAGRSSTRPYICEYHSITPRPIPGTTTKLPIQDVATSPTDRVDPILVQEPSEPAMTSSIESTHSSSAQSSDLDRKDTVPSSASGRLSRKPSRQTTRSTTATTASTTSTAKTSTTTDRSTSSQPPAVIKKKKDNIACNVGYFGTDCSSPCPTNCKTGECDVQSGLCIGGCKAGYDGDKCENSSSSGVYCENCTKDVL